MPNIRTKILTSLFSLLMLASEPAMAQITLEDAQQARDLRLAVFELLSHNVQPVAMMVRMRQPLDRNKIITNAKRIEILSMMILDTFETDTRGAPIYTLAKDFIWDNPDTFREHALDLQRGALKLQEVAVEGDLRALALAQREMGQACGACHDLFRFQESDPALPVPSSQ